MANPLDILSDDDLMMLVRQENEMAFETVVQRHGPALIRFVGGYVHDGFVAEDISQEVFLKCWRLASDYRPTGRFRGWLYRIARNLAIDNIRSKRGRESMPAESSDDRPSDRRRETRVQPSVADALGILAPADREILRMRYWDGLSYTEMADTLRCSMKVVSVRLTRARFRLKNLAGQFA